MLERPGIDNSWSALQIFTTGNYYFKQNLQGAILKEKLMSCNDVLRTEK